MAFIRTIKKPYGTYYALVENKRIGGKVRQKHLKYLGTSPVTTKVEVDPAVAPDVAHALLTGELASQELRKRLESLGLSIPKGKIRKVSLTYDTIKKTLSLHIE